MSLINLNIPVTRRMTFDCDYACCEMRFDWLLLSSSSTPGTEILSTVPFMGILKVCFVFAFFFLFSTPLSFFLGTD